MKIAKRVKIGGNAYYIIVNVEYKKNRKYISFTMP